MTDIYALVLGEDPALVHEYDPIKAREYYLRTRELKGRKVINNRRDTAPGQKTKGRAPGIVKRGAHVGPVDPRSQVSFDGNPIGKLPKRKLEEDQVPEVSRSGAKLLDFDGSTGRATYSDGTAYDGFNGWGAGRINDAQKKLNEAKKLVNNLPPDRAAEMRKRLEEAERSLHTMRDYKSDATRAQNKRSQTI